jgi:CubicO group peptidase (beta-lactamase class C family)
MGLTRDLPPPVPQPATRRPVSRLMTGIPAISAARRAALLLLVLLIAASLQAQQRLFDDPRRIEAWLQENHVPAVGIGVIRDGQVRDVEVYGELKKGTPAPYDTIFNVASLTKPVVAMVTLRLVSEGKWKLDEPLAKYWIDPDVAGDPRAKLLTTRHVLSHQTGFANWRWLEESKKLRFQFDPGTKFQYSGEGFEYLRRALEKKFGQPLAALSRSVLFTPLGMHDTQHAWDAHTDASRFARWHDAEGNHKYTDDRTTRANAADDLLTTVADYAKFGVAVMNGDGLTKKVFDEMVKPQAAMKKDSMGLGWEVHPLGAGGEYALIHSGSDEGVHALVILLPKSKQGLVVMTNGDNGWKVYEKAVTELLDRGAEIMKTAG